MFKTYGLGAICFAPDGAAGGSSGSESGESTSTEAKASESKSDFDVSIEASQGLEGINEDLLMGHDPEVDAEAAKAADTDTKKTDSKADDKTSSKPADEAKAKADSKDAQSKDSKAALKSATESKPASSESKAGDDAKKSDTDDSQKPPKGYVPLEALHEVRETNKYLKDRIKELQSKQDTRPAPKDTKSEPEPKKSVLPEDFRVLSDKEFTELADEDPKEALLYMKNLGVHQEEQRQAQLEEQQKQWKERDDRENQAKMQTIFDETSRKMEEFVPGLFDEESTAGKELAEFANTLGFTDDMYYLTNPQTQIILPGETEPLLLGEQAASIIQTLASARSQITDLKEKTVDETKLREEITKEVEAKLRKDIEAEFLAKFKTGPDEAAFRSLTSVPSSETPEFTGKVLTEAEFARLPEAEQELYLAGT